MDTQQWHEGNETLKHWDLRRTFHTEVSTRGGRWASDSGGQETPPITILFNVTGLRADLGKDNRQGLCSPEFQRWGLGDTEQNV